MAAVPKKEPINQKSEVRKVERALLAAIKYDIDTLAKKFLTESEDLSLQRFGRLFNEMEFPTIFIGHLSFADLVEFSENLFHYAAHYMFGPLTNRAVPDYVQLPELQTEATKNKLAQMFPGPEQRTNEQRIFGIFVTYCLYFVQPTQYVVPVFTTKLQLDDLYEFMATVLLPDDYSEPLYCLFRLIQANAFAIYPFDGKFNPLLHRYFTLFDGDDVGGGDEIDSHELENLEDLGRLRELAKDYNIQQLENLHQLYMEEKRQNNSIGLPQSALAPREGPHEMLNRLIQETEAKMRNNSSNSSSILEQIKMENVTGEHPKTLLSRRNKIRQMAFTQNTSFRRDRRHRNMAAEADESMDNYDDQPSSSSTIQQKQQKSPRKAIKKETNEGGEDEEGKARKRRRSTRSRTHEFEGSDDPVEAAILREIEMLANSSNENDNRLLQITNEPSEMDQIMASMLVRTADNDNEMEIEGGSSQPQPTMDANNEPGPSTSSTSREELERKIEAIKGNEAETDKLWAQILAEKTLEQQQEKQQKKKTSNRGRPRKKQ